MADAVLAAPVAEHTAPPAGLVTARVSLPLRRDAPGGVAEVRAAAAAAGADAAAAASPVARKRLQDRAAALRYIHESIAQGDGYAEEADLTGRLVEGELACLRLGPVRLLMLSGEPFTALSAALEAATGALIIGGAGGYLGYLAPPDEVAPGGYEVSDMLLDGQGVTALMEAAIDLTA
ncbi:MAG: hypothetical protein ABIF71_10470 [Planctomycetota bacterium]